MPGESSSHVEGEVGSSSTRDARFVPSDANGAAELDFPLRVEAAEDGGAADTALADIIKAFIVPWLRARLAALVAELRNCE